jgi:hypothetical protein
MYISPYVELAATSSQALGTAFEGLTQGVSKVNTQLGTHSRNLVQKKYGEDYVKTFFPESEVEQESSKIDGGGEHEGVKNSGE